MYVLKKDLALPKCSDCVSPKALTSIGAFKGFIKVVKVVKGDIGIKVKT